MKNWDMTDRAKKKIAKSLDAAGVPYEVKECPFKGRTNAEQETVTAFCSGDFMLHIAPTFTCYAISHIESGLAIANFLDASLAPKIFAEMVSNGFSLKGKTPEDIKSCEGYQAFYEWALKYKSYIE